MKKRNGNKKKGQKVSKSKRQTARKNVRKRPTPRVKKTSGKTAKRAIVPKKGNSKRTVSLSGKQSKASKRSPAKNVRKSRVETVTIAKRKRNKETINISFGKTRKVETKIKAFEQSEKLTKAVKNQLTRKGGKPPKGMVIVVRDKKGNEAAHVSRPSFVANEKNIKKELDRFTKELKNDYSKFAQELAKKENKKSKSKYVIPRPRKPRKRKGESDYSYNKRFSNYKHDLDLWENGELDDSEQVDGYEDFNPDNINEIDIKFIY